MPAPRGSVNARNTGPEFVQSSMFSKSIPRLGISGSNQQWASGLGALPQASESGHTLRQCAIQPAQPLTELPVEPT
jgi:hypothetical protein